MADVSSRPPVPPAFAAAVADLRAVRTRAEVMVERIGAPQRLAPWAYALSVEVRDASGDDPAATGRLVLLHDPAGQEGWDGTFRFVAFGSADIDPEIGWDPLLAGVTWSWLVDALALRGAAATAMGGTVTQTASTRFGALAPSASAEPDAPEIDLDEPTVALEVELRGSWTPLGDDFGAHLLGFADLLCTAAGLPPEGVADLSGR